tara:strand:+ start:3443 stop:3634 length:192 start_codon:yes stop_codon:yes gene_type:complete
MKKIEKNLKIIDKIELVRKKNNINWMNLMKIAFKYAPVDAKKCVAQISKQDKQINELIKKLIK